MFDRGALLGLLKNLDLGASVAEVDDILYQARVETGTFWNLFKDSVDLIPGTKGSGKSALFKLFVKYLPETLLKQKKVVLAHGIDIEGDQVFHVFTDRFDRLTASEFQNFWYVYFVSLISEVLLKQERFRGFFTDAQSEISDFQVQCAAAKIPDIKAPQTLKGVIEWCINAATRNLKPRKVSVPIGAGEKQLELEFGEQPTVIEPLNEKPLPLYVDGIRSALNALLAKADITIWLMLDKLDEIFPRWSDVERKGLSSLLRAMYSFRGDRVRVKIFLRDDIFEHLTSGEEGFPGLTHITARMASSLSWRIEDILQLIVKRVFVAHLGLVCGIDSERLNANHAYREEAFYKAFPRQVHKGERQSSTIDWIYTHCQDGRKVVAPRDVVDLLIFTRDAEIQLLQSNTEGTSDCIFSSAAIERGFKMMSKHKRDVFLQAEFPHFRDDILRFENGPAIYSRDALGQLFGNRVDEVVDKLAKIGFLTEQSSKQGPIFTIPFLYRPAFEVRQTKAKYGQAEADD